MVPRPGRDHEKCWLGKHHRPLPPSGEALRYATLIAPKLTIQGGTREVLRGIIARGLGLR